MANNCPFCGESCPPTPGKGFSRRHWTGKALEASRERRERTGRIGFEVKHNGCQIVGPGRKRAGERKRRRRRSSFAAG